MGGRLGVVDGVLGTHQLTSAISTSAERMGMTQLSHCCRFWRSVESSISVSAVEQEMPNYILGYGRKGCATYGRNGLSGWRNQRLCSTKKNSILRYGRKGCATYGRNGRWRGNHVKPAVKRLRMRPDGVVSKKSVGAARMAAKSFSWRCLDARTPITTIVRIERR